MEASVTLGLNAGPFTAGLQKAQASAKQFAGTMGAQNMWNFMGGAPVIARAGDKAGRTFSERFVGMFRRTAEHRAESQIGLFAANLASGNVGGAIMGLSRSISGFGLAAGIGVGIAIEGFIKFKGQLDETKKATQAVNQELSKPLYLQGALGPEGIGKEIEKANATLENLAEKRKSAGSVVKDFFERHPIPSIGMDLAGTAGRKGPSVEQKAQQGETKRTYDLMVKQVEAEERVTSAQRTGLEISKEAGEIDRLRNDIIEKRSAILLAARPKVGTIDPLGAALALRSAQNVSAAGELKIDAVKKQADLKNKELALEERILLLGASGLTNDQKRLAIIKERVAALSKAIIDEPDPLKKRALGNQQFAARTELRDVQFDAADQSPDAVTARNAANLGALGRRAFNTRVDQMENPNRAAYGAVMSGVGALGPQSSARMTPDYASPEFSSNLGGLGSHMATYGGSDYFNKVFSAPGTGGGSHGGEDKPADIGGILGEIKTGIDDLNSKWQ